MGKDKGYWWGFNFGWNLISMIIYNIKYLSSFVIYNMKKIKPKKSTKKFKKVIDKSR